MNSYVRNLLAMLTATIFSIGTTQEVHAAKFLGLGDLAGGDFSSVANGVSANGSVVVGYGQTAAIGSEAYRWTSGSGMVGLGDLVGGDFSSAANGVSADGSVVIGLGNSPAGQEAFRWTIADGMQGLGDLDGGDARSGAYGVSADGSVVVGFGNNATRASEPFRWTSGSGPVGLGDLEGGNFFSFAFGVSADGSVVVGQGHNSDFATEAFRWTSSGGMVGLGDLEAGIFRSIANGVSADGSEPTVSTGKGLTVEGTATLTKPVTLDGGTLTVGILVNGSNLLFNRGTLALTNQDLVIGSAGLFGDALTLADRNIAVTANTTIVPGASLLLQGGSFSSYILTNYGSVTLDGVNSTLAGAVVFNSGVLRGDGRITAPVNNLVAGEIRGEPGRSLMLTGPGNANSGQINLFGGLVEFAQNLANDAGGFVSGNGTLIVRDGLVNHGTMNFSGSANLVGDTTNAAGGKIISAGGGPTTFYDDVTNEGEIRTSAGSFTVFFGAVAGSGMFTGTGTVNFEGDLRPGNSPAAVQFGGDVAFGSEATFTAEIAGTTPGSQYDQILIAGSASFAGTLDVDLIDLGGGAYVPSVGDQFILATYASHTGTFDTLSLPPLASGLDWSLDYESTLLTLSISSTVLPGDIDLDGDVDRTDAALFSQHFGTTAGAVWTTGDFDGDGRTSLHDLALQQANFGAVRPSPVAASAAVPEPSTMVLAAMATLFALGLNRQSGRGA